MIRCIELGQPATQQEFIKVKNQLVLTDSILIRSVKLQPNDIEEESVLPEWSVEEAIDHAYKVTS